MANGKSGLTASREAWDNPAMVKKWWGHEWSVAKRAAKATSLNAAGAGFFIAVFAYGLQWNFGWRGQHEIERSVVIGLASAAVGILCEFLVRIHLAATRVTHDQE